MNQIICKWKKNVLLFFSGNFIFIFAYLNEKYFVIFSCNFVINSMDRIGIMSEEIIIEYTI